MKKWSLELTQPEIDAWLDLLVPDGFRTFSKLDILEEMIDHKGEDHMSLQDEAIILGCIERIKEQS